MAQRLLLVRHASTGEALRGRFVGRTDAPLHDDGRRQARALAERLAGRGVDKMVCSPLCRAVETARILGSAAGLPMNGRPPRPAAEALVPVAEPDLAEIDFGRWEGRNFEEIHASDAALVDAWARFAPEFAFPEGESLAGFLDRVRRVTERLTNDPAESILVVAHGGVVRAMLCQLLGLPARCYLAFDIRPACLCVVRVSDGIGVLEEMTNGDGETGKLGD